MNHNRISKLGIVVLLAAMVLAGCASAKADPSPTCAPSPTQAAQTCPTPVAQLPVTNAWWNQNLGDYVNFVITIESGNKCRLDVIKPIVSSNWGYELVVNDNTYHNYMVSVMTLVGAATDADLQEWTQANPNSQELPPFVNLRLYDAVNPMTNTFHGESLTEGPIYLTCLAQGPSDQIVLGSFGPIDLMKNP